MPDLLLASNGSTETEEDYDVISDGRLVGHIFKPTAAPVQTPWMWALSIHALKIAFRHRTVMRARARKRCRLSQASGAGEAYDCFCSQFSGEAESAASRCDFVKKKPPDGGEMAEGFRCHLEEV